MKNIFYHRQRGIFYFRIFGHGISFKNLEVWAFLFPHPNPIIIGKYSIQYLKPLSAEDLED